MTQVRPADAGPSDAGDPSGGGDQPPTAEDGWRGRQARRGRPSRPFARLSWDVRSCGLHGHATYAPIEPELTSRLGISTPVGDAWRCLRCGDYVLGEPRGRGPADEAPIVLRGKALRDAFILRVLAVERGLRGLVLVALAYGIWRFDGARASLAKLVDSYLPAITPLATRLGIDLANTGPAHTVARLFALGKGTLVLLAVGVLLYGLLEITEAVGLWLIRRWGEYVAAAGTSLFVPLEIYELIDKVTWLRVGAFVLNLFAIAYLLWTKRLFGVRGGRAAFEAERRGASLMEVEQSALRADRG